MRVAGRADIVPSVLTDLIAQAVAFNAELDNPAECTRGGTRPDRAAGPPGRLVSGPPGLRAA
ncbi:MAG TPA: hypothetical protein VFQ44_15420 [Streptosporangiaceae bacterium]|nr:hypothetical protein [Streptosporangiaceae bacterium]